MAGNRVSSGNDVGTIQIPVGAEVQIGINEAQLQAQLDATVARVRAEASTRSDKIKVATTNTPSSNSAKIEAGIKRLEVFNAQIDANIDNKLAGILDLTARADAQDPTQSNGKLISASLERSYKQFNKALEKSFKGIVDFNGKSVSEILKSLDNLDLSSGSVDVGFLNKFLKSNVVSLRSSLNSLITKEIVRYDKAKSKLAELLEKQQGTKASPEALLDLELANSTFDAQKGPIEKAIKDHKKKTDKIEAELSKYDELIAKRLRSSTVDISTVFSTKLGLDASSQFGHQTLKGTQEIIKAAEAYKATLSLEDPIKYLDDNAELKKAYTVKSLRKFAKTKKLEDLALNSKFKDLDVIKAATAFRAGEIGSTSPDLAAIDEIINTYKDIESLFKKAAKDTDFKAAKKNKGAAKKKTQELESKLNELKRARDTAQSIVNSQTKSSDLDDDAKQRIQSQIDYFENEAALALIERSSLELQDRVIEEGVEGAVTSVNKAAVKHIKPELDIINAHIGRAVDKNTSKSDRKSAINLIVKQIEALGVKADKYGDEALTGTINKLRQVGQALQAFDKDPKKLTKVFSELNGFRSDVQKYGGSAATFGKDSRKEIQDLFLAIPNNATKATGNAPEVSADIITAQAQAKAKQTAENIEAALKSFDNTKDPADELKRIIIALNQEETKYTDGIIRDLKAVKAAFTTVGLAEGNKALKELQFRRQNFDEGKLNSILKKAEGAIFTRITTLLEGISDIATNKLKSDTGSATNSLNGKVQYLVDRIKNFNKPTDIGEVEKFTGKLVNDLTDIARKSAVLDPKLAERATTIAKNIVTNGTIPFSQISALIMDAGKITDVNYDSSNKINKVFKSIKDAQKKGPLDSATADKYATELNTLLNSFNSSGAFDPTSIRTLAQLIRTKTKNTYSKFTNNLEEAASQLEFALGTKNIDSLAKVRDRFNNLVTSGRQNAASSLPADAALNASAGTNAAKALGEVVGGPLKTLSLKLGNEIKAILTTALNGIQYDASKNAQEELKLIANKSTEAGEQLAEYSPTLSAQFLNLSESLTNYSGDRTDDFANRAKNMFDTLVKGLKLTDVEIKTMFPDLVKAAGAMKQYGTAIREDFKNKATDEQLFAKKREGARTAALKEGLNAEDSIANIYPDKFDDAKVATYNVRLAAASLANATATENIVRLKLLEVERLKRASTGTAFGAAEQAAFLAEQAQVDQLKAANAAGRFKETTSAEELIKVTDTSFKAAANTGKRDADYDEAEGIAKSLGLSGGLENLEKVAKSGLFQLSKKIKQFGYQVFQESFSNMSSLILFQLGKVFSEAMTEAKQIEKLSREVTQSDVGNNGVIIRSKEVVQTQKFLASAIAGASFGFTDGSNASMEYIRGLKELGFSAETSGKKLIQMSNIARNSNRELADVIKAAAAVDKIYGRVNTEVSTDLLAKSAKNDVSFEKTSANFAALGANEEVKGAFSPDELVDAAIKYTKAGQEVGKTVLQVADDLHNFENITLEKPTAEVNKLFGSMRVGVQLGQATEAVFNSFLTNLNKSGIGTFMEGMVTGFQLITGTIQVAVAGLAFLNNTNAKPFIEGFGALAGIVTTYALFNAGVKAASVALLAFTGRMTSAGISIAATATVSQVLTRSLAVGLIPAATALTTALKFLTGPIGITISVLGAAVTAWQLYQNSLKQTKTEAVELETTLSNLDKQLMRVGSVKGITNKDDIFKGLKDGEFTKSNGLIGTDEKQLMQDLIALPKGNKLISPEQQAMLRDASNSLSKAKDAATQIRTNLGELSSSFAGTSGPFAQMAQNMIVTKEAAIETALALSNIKDPTDKAVATAQIPYLQARIQAVIAGATAAKANVPSQDIDEQIAANIANDKLNTERVNLQNRNTVLQEQKSRITSDTSIVQGRYDKLPVKTESDAKAMLQLIEDSNEKITAINVQLDSNNTGINSISKQQYDLKVVLAKIEKDRAASMLQIIKSSSAALLPEEEKLFKAIKNALGVTYAGLTDAQFLEAFKNDANVEADVIRTTVSGIQSPTQEAPIQPVVQGLITYPADFAAKQKEADVPKTLDLSTYKQKIGEVLTNYGETYSYLVTSPEAKSIRKMLNDVTAQLANPAGVLSTGDPLEQLKALDGIKSQIKNTLEFIEGTNKFINELDFIGTTGDKVSDATTKINAANSILEPMFQELDTLTSNADFGKDATSLAILQGMEGSVTKIGQALANSYKQVISQMIQMTASLEQKNVDIKYKMEARLRSASLANIKDPIERQRQQDILDAELEAKRSMDDLNKLRAQANVYEDFLNKLDNSMHPMILALDRNTEAQSKIFKASIANGTLNPEDSNTLPDGNGSGYSSPSVPPLGKAPGTNNDKGIAGKDRAEETPAVPADPKIRPNLGNDKPVSPRGDITPDPRSGDVDPRIVPTGENNAPVAPRRVVPPYVEPIPAKPRITPPNTITPDPRPIPPKPDETPKPRVVPTDNTVPVGDKVPSTIPGTETPKVPPSLPTTNPKPVPVSIVDPKVIPVIDTKIPPVIPTPEVIPTPKPVPTPTAPPADTTIKTPPAEPIPPKAPVIPVTPDTETPRVPPDTELPKVPTPNTPPPDGVPNRSPDGSITDDRPKGPPRQRNPRIDRIRLPPGGGGVGIDIPSFAADYGESYYSKSADSTSGKTPIVAAPKGPDVTGASDASKITAIVSEIDKVLADKITTMFSSVYTTVSDLMNNLDTKLAELETKLAIARAELPAVTKVVIDNPTARGQVTLDALSNDIIRLNAEISKVKASIAVVTDLVNNSLKSFVADVEKLQLPNVGEKLTGLGNLITGFITKITAIAPSTDILTTALDKLKLALNNAAVGTNSKAAAAVVATVDSDKIASAVAGAVKEGLKGTVINVTNAGTVAKDVAGASKAGVTVTTITNSSGDVKPVLVLGEEISKVLTGDELKSAMNLEGKTATQLQETIRGYRSQLDAIGPKVTEASTNITNRINILERALAELSGNEDEIKASQKQIDDAAKAAKAAVAANNARLADRAKFLANAKKLIPGASEADRIAIYNAAFERRDSNSTTYKSILDLGSKFITDASDANTFRAAGVDLDSKAFKELPVGAIVNFGPQGRKVTLPVSNTPAPKPATPVQTANADKVTPSASADKELTLDEAEKAKEKGGNEGLSKYLSSKGDDALNRFLKSNLKSLGQLAAVGPLDMLAAPLMAGGINNYRINAAAGYDTGKYNLVVRKFMDMLAGGIQRNEKGEVTKLPLLDSATMAALTAGVIDLKIGAPTIKQPTDSESFSAYKNLSDDQIRILKEQSTGVQKGGPGAAQLLENLKLDAAKTLTVEADLKSPNSSGVAAFNVTRRNLQTTAAKYNSVLPASAPRAFANELAPLAGMTLVQKQEGSNYKISAKFEKGDAVVRYAILALTADNKIIRPLDAGAGEWARVNSEDIKLNLIATQANLGSGMSANSIIIKLAQLDSRLIEKKVAKFQVTATSVGNVVITKIITTPNLSAMIASAKKAKANIRSSTNTSDNITANNDSNTYSENSADPQSTLRAQQSNDPRDGGSNSGDTFVGGEYQGIIAGYNNPNEGDYVSDAGPTNFSVGGRTESVTKKFEGATITVDAERAATAIPEGVVNSNNIGKYVQIARVYDLTVKVGGDGPRGAYRSNEGLIEDRKFGISYTGALTNSDKNAADTASGQTEAGIEKVKKANIAYANLNATLANSQRIVDRYMKVWTDIQGHLEQAIKSFLNLPAVFFAKQREMKQKVNDMVNDAAIISVKKSSVVSDINDIRTNMQNAKTVEEYNSYVSQLASAEGQLRQLNTEMAVWEVGLKNVKESGFNLGEELGNIFNGLADGISNTFAELGKDTLAGILFKDSNERGIGDPFRAKKRIDNASALSKYYSDNGITDKDDNTIAASMNSGDFSGLRNGASATENTMIDLLEKGNVNTKITAKGMLENVAQGAAAALTQLAIQAIINATLSIFRQAFSKRESDSNKFSAPTSFDSTKGSTNPNMPISVTINGANKNEVSKTVNTELDKGFNKLRLGF